MRFFVPVEVDDEIINFAKALKGTWIGHVLIEPKSASKFNCHIACDPALRETGYAILKSEAGLHAFLHSVENRNGTLVDVSSNYRPNEGCLFVRCLATLNDPEHLMYASNSVIINRLSLKHMENDMYYVYALIDPRSNTPFYVGKGKGDRWKSHFSQKRKRNDNWFKMCVIEAIRADGLEPGVEFLATSIENESMAYDIEASYIKQYGKRSENGLLVNICDDNRPPNHAGKSYEEIYGDKAAEQRINRAKVQTLRGGYGPKEHKPETKQKISKSLIGNKRALGYRHTPKTKLKMQQTRLERLTGNRKAICLDNGNETHLLPLADLSFFCKSRGLSSATFKTQLYKDWPRSKKGKNKGWKATFSDSKL